MTKQLKRYISESHRLNLCEGLVACYVSPEVAVECSAPVKNLLGPMGTVEIDVEKLKRARDVSVN